MQHSKAFHFYLTRSLSVIFTVSFTFVIFLVHKQIMQRHTDGQEIIVQATVQLHLDPWKIGPMYKKYKSSIPHTSPDIYITLY